VSTGDITLNLTLVGAKGQEKTLTHSFPPGKARLDFNVRIVLNRLVRLGPRWARKHDIRGVVAAVVEADADITIRLGPSGIE
jgi:hypothetical protein